MLNTGLVTSGEIVDTEAKRWDLPVLAPDGIGQVSTVANPGVDTAVLLQLCRRLPV